MNIKHKLYRTWEKVAEPAVRLIHRRLEYLDRQDLRKYAFVTKPTRTRYIKHKGKTGATYPKYYYTPGPRALAQFNDVVFVGDRGLSIFDDKIHDNNIIVDTVGPPTIADRRTKLAIRSMLRATGRLKRQNVDRAVSLLPPFRNYYHWTVGGLMKLYMLEKHLEDMPTLIVPEFTEPFIDESLDLLGYGDDDILRWGHHRGTIGTLYVPTFPDPTVEEVKWLRDRMHTAVQPENEELHLFVCRTDTRARQVLNQDELSEALPDVRFIDPGHYSMTDQISMFSRAKTIIGPHGAGLTNMMYATQANVIELHGVKNAASFERLADVSGHEYQKLRCETHDKHLRCGPDIIGQLIEGVNE